MKRLNNIVAALLCAALILSIASPCFAVDDTIIAVVNDELITLKDLKDYIRQTYAQLKTEGVEETTIKEIMLDLEVNGLDKLIQDKLVLSRAKQLKLEVRPELVEQRMEEVKSRYPSEEVFIDALVKHGGTLTDMRNKVEEQFKLKSVVEHEVSSKIIINPREITEFYEKNINQFKRKGFVNLNSIYIDFKDNKTQAKQKADEAIKLLNEGRDFNEVAQDYSDTPPLGIVERGQFMPELEDKIFVLEKGQMTDIIPVDSGYYIFQVIDKVSEETAPLTEVNEQIKNYLFQLKFKERLDEWLAQLKKNAYVEIKQ